VSAAEVDHHDSWQRAAVAFACLSTSTRHVHTVLAKVADLIERQGEIVLMDFEVEIR